MALQYVPFSSDIELPFYPALYASKIDHDKLDVSVRKVIGQYSPMPVAPEQSVKMQIPGDALTRDESDREYIRAEGSIKNVNTMEDFKTADIAGMLNLAGRQIWDAINDGSIFEVPSLLASFVILSYADLKKYRFTFRFGFPALHSQPAWRKVGGITRLAPKESAALVEQVGTWTAERVNSRQHGFFLAKKVRDADLSEYSTDANTDLHELNDEFGYTWQIGKLADYETGFFNDILEEDCYVCFVDSSTYAENPSWPLRNLLCLIRQRFRLSKVNILCYRERRASRFSPRSIILTLESDSAEPVDPTIMPNVTGWERDGKTKLRARVANLAEHMDPNRLADQSLDLNLKLMKWRNAPDLDLDSIRHTKCLLLGSGTLGSHVARNLLSWGVRTITFVDSARVSFSNPARQSLFTFEDALGGGKLKAPQAAEAMTKIFPGIEATGHALGVPMLGHPFADEAKTREDYFKLKRLIDEHDAIFLLMDSRESRWLPSVMGKAAGKMVLNAALGFDSFVIMRHGAEPKDAAPDDAVRRTLGCYFCNDVVAPVNSQKNLTLDQQCTVTRPGLSAMASAQLVELLASMLQHPLKHHAPAPQTSGGSVPDRDPPDHPLGLVPHQVRGFASTFQNLVIRGESYPNCSACSPPILDAFRKDDWEFLKRALQDKDYVAELSGLAEVQRQAEKLSLEVEWDEEDEAVDGSDAELI